MRFSNLVFLTGVLWFSATGWAADVYKTKFSTKTGQCQIYIEGPTHKKGDKIIVGGVDATITKVFKSGKLKAVTADTINDSSACDELKDLNLSVREGQIYKVKPNKKGTVCNVYVKDAAGLEKGTEITLTNGEKANVVKVFKSGKAKATLGTPNCPEVKGTAITYTRSGGLLRDYTFIFGNAGTISVSASVSGSDSDDAAAGTDVSDPEFSGFVGSVGAGYSLAIGSSFTVPIWGEFGFISAKADPQGNSESADVEKSLDATMSFFGFGGGFLYHFNQYSTGLNLSYSLLIGGTLVETTETTKSGVKETVDATLPVTDGNLLGIQIPFMYDIGKTMTIGLHYTSTSGEFTVEKVETTDETGDKTSAGGKTYSPSGSQIGFLLKYKIR